MVNHSILPLVALAVLLPIMNSKVRYMRSPNAKKLDAEKLWAYALKSLGARAQSSGEVRQKLVSKADNLADVDGILARLREYGFLNDKRFAETVAASRLEDQGFGRARVIQDLRGRRIAPVLAETAVGGVYSETDELELIERYVRKKYRTAERDGFLGDDKELARAFGRLRRAGFGAGNIVRVLKRFARNPDLLDGIEDVPPPD